MTHNKIDQMRQAAKSNQIVCIIGAGVSISLSSPARPAPGWRTLLESGLQFAAEKGKIDSNQVERWQKSAQSNDMDEMLAAADFITKKLDGKKGLLYARWLELQFSVLKPASGPMKDAIIRLYNQRTPLCTLNYDTLLENATRSTSIDLESSRRVIDWTKRQDRGILHLHGIWDNPQTCVLSAADYESTTTNEFRQNLQRAITSFGTLVFIGCGETISDPNFSSLLAWTKEHIGSANSPHYALVKNDEVSARSKDPLWRGLIEPIGYGTSHDDLPNFIQNNLCHINSQSRLVAPRRKAADPEIVRVYKDYLIRDCGRMTIEGVRADADTAKQKFDIENLFVPLEMQAIEPDFPQTDLNREKKIKKWRETNSEPKPFGVAFTKHSKMAILALPGGGKTLLLKRLAVAYSDETRRNATDDGLPQLDVLPILIRCREWRDYIKLPIQGIIERLGDVTGKSELNGLFEATKARFKSGKILLMIDGLDEIHVDSDRAIFVENLERFLEEFPKIRLLVTSREAGFSLIAPTLSRFCIKWRIAPLSAGAIGLLCTYWHTLMVGESPDVSEEIRLVTGAILANSAIRRLAENPLLLTMLLVVKHGHGRLPPDRVSLYERAVEVLLDTWNIKGHAALNPREAVPQLAYLAFRLMERGQQTATQKEILTILEECRDRVSLVRLYAKDSPSEFLARVELRSSLLLEGGHAFENGKSVPFYQFRHLTFQEYLASVAIVEGHYDNYSHGDEVTRPLRAFIVSDEWKEVVPMVAVLAKKQAAPLINALISLGEQVERDFFAGDHKLSPYEWSTSYRLPAPVARLTQCLAEEAELSESALTKTLRLVAIFAHGCQSSENWAAIRRGPYGDNLFATAWELYCRGNVPTESWLRNTVALLAGHLKSDDEWKSDVSIEDLGDKLDSDDSELKGMAAAAICGAIWLYRDSVFRDLRPFHSALERNVVSESGPIFELTAWALAMLQSSQKEIRPIYPTYNSTIDFLVSKWLKDTEEDEESIIHFVIFTSISRTRFNWKPDIDENVVQRLLGLLQDGNRSRYGGHSAKDVAGLLLYHANLTGPIGDIVYKLLERLSVEGGMLDRIRHIVRASENMSGDS